MSSHLISSFLSTLWFVSGLAVLPKPCKSFLFGNVYNLSSIFYSTCICSVSAVSAAAAAKTTLLESTHRVPPCESEQIREHHGFFHCRHHHNSIIILIWDVFVVLVLYLFIYLFNDSLVLSNFSIHRPSC